MYQRIHKSPWDNPVQTKSTPIAPLRSIVQTKPSQFTPTLTDIPVLGSQTREDRSSQRRWNNIGLPNHLKAGVENLSGYALDDVKVHYNSSKPAQIGAFAYAQGTEIHIAPGQEKHLAHEAWHVVQQKQGRVKPTMQMGNVKLNHDQRLEQEADVMGQRGLSIGQTQTSQATEMLQNTSPIRTGVVQRVPYQMVYSQSQTRRLLNDSEERASPVNNQIGHPRQHVGRWEKAERYAEEQSKTKSVFLNTEEQDKAIRSALNSAAGQVELGKLDLNANVSQRVAIKDVAVDAVEVKVVKAKKKKDPGAVGVKSWSYQSGIATKATVIVDSMGTGNNGDIHIQTAFPIFD